MTRSKTAAMRTGVGTKVVPLFFAVLLCAEDSPQYDTSGPLPADSVYHLTAEFTDQNSQAVRLSDLRGRPVVLATIYTHCPQICPRLVADMKRIQAALPDNARPLFVGVSIDPERDTPAALSDFHLRHQLDDDWTLLTGDPESVLILTAALGYNYRPTPDGEFVHSVRIVVLDPNGSPSMEYVGLTNDISSFVEEYDEHF